MRIVVDVETEQPGSRVERTVEVPDAELAALPARQRRHRLEGHAVNAAVEDLERQATWARAAERDLPASLDGAERYREQTWRRAWTDALEGTARQARRSYEAALNGLCPPRAARRLQ